MHHISADSIVRMSGETRALDGFYEALYTERTKCKVSRRFRDENAQKVLPPRAFSLASKQVVNIHFLDSDLNFDLSLLSRKINHEEEEEEASDQRRSKVEDVEEKETKRKERNAEEIARRKQGAETVTETETAATSGYPLSASSIVVITRKRKLRGSETVGKVVKVGWGGGG